MAHDHWPAERDLYWTGSSKKDLLTLPESVRQTFGYALHLAQRGERHVACKPLRGLGGAGVLEVVEDDEGGTCRAVYTVNFDEAVFVLHCFQKKSSSGIATPKKDIDLMRQRLQMATDFVRELRNVNRKNQRG
jgi:phage-related protein